MNTTIINLYSGPGTGKSTSAAYLFYLLKSKSENAELVREYVKNWAYENRKISVYDQLYFLGKQSRTESMLYGKVNYIITDSPVFISLYYAQKYCPPSFSEGIRSAVLSFYRQSLEDGHKHIHCFLNRSKPYVSVGRFQTESEAKQIDLEMKRMLEELRIPFINSGTDEQDLKLLLENIKATNV